MKKSLISRLTSGFIAAFIMAVICSFCAIPASAAIDVDTLADTVISADDTYSMQLLARSADTVQIIPLANNQNNNNNQNENKNIFENTDADTSYESVVNTFIKWIRRVGAMIAFVGGIMFALGNKNNDGEQKQQGLLTMVAGFIVVALCIGASVFNLFE